MPEACDMPLYNVIIVSPGLTLTAEVRWKNVAAARQGMDLEKDNPYSPLPIPWLKGCSIHGLQPDCGETTVMPYERRDVTVWSLRINM